MLTNSYILYETATPNMNTHHGEEFLFRQNFNTQELPTMINWEGSNVRTNNISIQLVDTNTTNLFDPVEIVKTTNLRIDAAEFVPRHTLSENVNINYGLTNVIQSAVSTSSDDFNTVPSSTECNKISWADEVVDENLCESLNSEYYKTEVNKDVPVTQENEDLVSLNTEFEGIIIDKKGESPIISADETHPPEEVNYTNRNNRIDQNRTKENILDKNNKHFQFHEKREYRNTKRDGIRNDENYRFKGKPRYSYRENFSRSRQETQGDYKKTYPTNSKQENEFSDQNLDTSTRQTKKNSDRTKTLDRYYNYDQRLKYQRPSPNFIQNKNDQQSSTNEVNHKQEIPNDNRCISNITTKEDFPDQTGTTSTWRSHYKEHTKENSNRNKFRYNKKEQESKSEVHQLNEYKRKTSDWQVSGTKDIEESKLFNEEKGAKPKNHKGKFLNPRNRTYHSKHFHDKKQDEWHVDSAEHNLPIENNDEGEFERKSKPYQHIEYKNKKFETKNIKTSNNGGFDLEKHKQEVAKRSLDTNKHFKTSNNEGFDVEKHKQDKPRRSLDTVLKSSKYKSHNGEDKTISYRRSFNKDEIQGPSKSFRDALFAEKNSEKPRDLKKERSGIKIKINININNKYEDKRNKSDSESNIECLFDKTYAEFDSEYKEFLQELVDHKIVPSEKIIEKKQDLFQMPIDYSLAHCVAEDLRMGSGIAVTFRNKFSNVDSLLNMREKSGGLVILKEGSRFLYYLITKKRSRDKPTYKDFWCSMKRLRDHIKKYQITKLAVPTLGCGLDQLNWSIVKNIMEFLFRNVPIEIVVCHFSPTEEIVPKNFIKINRKNDSLKNAKEPIIVYFTTADSVVSDEIVELNERFSFLEDFKKVPKRFGSVIQYNVSNCTLCACVVKRNIKDLFSYKSFAVALKALNGIISEQECDTIALQYFKDEEDDLLHQKIITMIVNFLICANVNVYIGQTDVSFGET